MATLENPDLCAGFTSGKLKSERKRFGVMFKQLFAVSSAIGMVEGMPSSADDFFAGDYKLQSISPDSSWEVEKQLRSSELINFYINYG